MTKRFPFHPYPNSWFVVAFSHELAPGGVMPLHYFGMRGGRDQQQEDHAFNHSLSFRY